MSTRDFDTSHLKGKAKEAADLIVTHIRDTFDHEPDGGGCKAFWTPKEWKAKGENYGRDSVLVLCHDGGDLGPFFSYDYEAYTLMDQMRDKLAAIGLYPEQCTGWYTALYEL